MDIIGQVKPSAHLVNGKVPASELPSYVDDVLEFEALSDFPATGEAGKIYVDKTTNYTYRWSGTTYIQIGGKESFIEVYNSGTSYLYTGSELYNMYFNGKVLVRKGNIISHIMWVSYLESQYYYIYISSNEADGRVNVIRHKVYPNSKNISESKSFISALNSDLAEKYTKPASGIPASDIASGVIPDISGKLDNPTGGSTGNVLKKTATSVEWGTVDGAKISNTELIIKSPTLPTGSTPLVDMPLGTVVYLDENPNEGQNSWVGYRVVEKRDNSVVIFRESNTGTSLTLGYVYANGPTDTYLNGSFMDRFKTNIKNLFVNDEVKYQDYSDQSAFIKSISRKVFVPSEKELFNTGTDLGTYWGQEPYPDDISWWQRTLRLEQTGGVVSADGATMKYWNSWGQSIDVVYFDWEIRPAIFIKNDAIVSYDSNNRWIVQSEEVIPYETTQIDAIRNVNKIYKIKDQDARTLIDAKYTKPSSGIPASDLASGVIPVVSGKEDTSNKVTSISASSTDTQYPSAKCVYDAIGDVSTAVAAINALIGGASS